VGVLAVVLPHPPQYNESGMLAVQISSVGAALALLIVGARTPAWLTTAGPFAAAAATSMVLLFSGSGTSPFILFYLWVVFYGFYFLSRRDAVLVALFATFCYVAVIVGFHVVGTVDTHAHANQDIQGFVLTAGTLAVAGVFIVGLRERVVRLIGQLTDAVTTDSLTGLLNRRGFHGAIEAEMARAQRSEHPFSLLLGDCDHFKQLNDRCGDGVGDEALIAIGRMFQNGRRVDVVSRVAGGEFALLLPDTDQHGAYLSAERMRMRLAEMFVDQPVPLTISFGVASFPAHGVTQEELLRAAGDALYAAKALGRDRSVLHSGEVAGILAGQRDFEATRYHAQLATVLNLAEALDMRDAGTASHSQTVGRYCEMMARGLSLGPERVERLRTAGVLHDIGKIGVADSILQKPGPLTPEEFEQMSKHPEIGARILGGSGLDDIREWVKAHHERPDGRGYPLGLSGDDLPLEVRILSVADAYEAMTSDRVYRKAIGAEAARRELEAGSGTQFDGAVVATFLRALDRKPRSAWDAGATQPGRSAGPVSR
jgi:diguanylate cyclase (GGDEF)-like protein/putative nucleotidyltransferase with HDIG domain